MQTRETISGAFQFWPLEKVIYGAGTAGKIGEEVAQRGAKRVFLISSPTVAEKTPLLNPVKQSLGDRLVAVFTKTVPHTPIDTVITAAQAARDAGADLIMSAGGGSAIDTAKGVVLCLAENIRDAETLKSYRVQIVDGKRLLKPVTGQALPHIAISSTLSAAEFSGVAGATDPEYKRKDLYIAPQIAARTVVIDPWMLVHTPAWLLLSTGIRSIDHAVETVCSRSSQPFTDGLSLHAVRLLVANLPLVKEDPADLTALLNCQFGSWLSMLSLGRVEWGASHGIGHQLGAVADVAHGYCSCIMLPHVMRYNSTVNAGKQRAIAEALGIDVRNLNDIDAASAAADGLHALVKRLGLPTSLQEVGVTREHFDKISEGAMLNMMVLSNPRPITGAATVRQLLESAWT